MAFPDILIGSKFDAKGFKQAESAVGKLNKSVKNLAGTFGLALGGAALVSYSKKAIKAFADDEKAARSLALALANTGNAFAACVLPQPAGPTIMIFLPRTADLTRYFHLTSDISRSLGLILAEFLINSNIGSSSFIGAGIGVGLSISYGISDSGTRFPLPDS